MLLYLSLFPPILFSLLSLVYGTVDNPITHSNIIFSGRKMGSSVTALSVCASDMSSWLLMALPGAIYLHGIHQLCQGVGLVIGLV